MTTPTTSLSIEQMQTLINENTLQFYKGKASLVDSTGVNSTTGITFESTFTDADGKLNKDKIRRLKEDLEKGETACDYKKLWEQFQKQPMSEKDLKSKFVNAIIKTPIETMVCVNANGIGFNGTDFVKKQNAQTDEDKFLNVLVYYLNINRIWQQFFNAITNPSSSTSPSSLSSSGVNGLYTYNKSALGTSSFDISSFRPWNTFGVAGFGRNPNFFPYGGNILPIGIVGGTQRGGSGQTCGHMIKNVVDSVIASSGGVDGEVKKKIDEQLNENIKYETLINQKLQQIVTISQTPMGGNNLDVTKYLDELQKLLTFLKDNQSLLFNTLRLSVSPTAIGYKLNQPQTTYRSLGDMLPQVGGGTPEQTAQMLDLLQRIATKLNA